jgi:hypothetical protein
MIRRLLALALILALVSPVAARAQNFGNIAPQTVLGNPSTTTKQPARPMPAPTLSPQNYGAKGDGVADDTTAVQAAFTAVCTAAAQRGLYIPDGTYKLTAQIVIPGPCAGMRAQFQSKNAVLSYAGTTNITGILKFDGVNANILSIDFGGGTITGNSHAQNAIWASGMLHSKFHDLKLRNITGSAFLGQFLVVDTLDNITTSNNDGAYTTKPTSCITFQTDGPNGGAYVVTLINPICEGVSGDGWVLSTSNGNVFVGGTSEGNGGRGLTLASDADRNTFQNADLEANAGPDMVVAGNYNQFINLTVASPPASPAHFIGGAGNTIIGGTYNQLTIDAGSTGTSLVGVRYGLAGGGLQNNTNTTTIINSSSTGAGGTTFPASGVATAGVISAIGPSDLRLNAPTGQEITMTINGVAGVNYEPGIFYPVSNNTTNLGAAANHWAAIYGTSFYGGMGATAGVTCTGPPSSSFASAGGIVTHC